MVYIKSININGGNRTMRVGADECLTATISPSNATKPILYWFSSNSEVVEIDKYTGCMYGMSAGTAVITARAQDGSGISGSCTVTVGSIRVSSIVLDKKA